MTPAGARSRAPTGVIVFPKGVSKGAQPLAAGGILPLCFLTFTQLSLVADDCKKLLVESMNAFLELHSRPAQGLGQRPQARLGHARSRQRQSPRPGLAESGCAQEKAELYLLEKAGRCLRRPGAQPPTSTWKTMTPVGARSRAPTGVIVFPKGFQRGSAPLPPEAFFLFAS